MEQKDVGGREKHHGERYSRSGGLVGQKKEQRERPQRRQKTLDFLQLLYVPSHNTDSPLEAFHLRRCLKRYCSRLVDHPTAACNDSKGNYAIIVDCSSRRVGI